MSLTREQYAGSAEALLVRLARNGDRLAFAELVQRRQGWVRALMRRCSGDLALADDLAQQVFLQAWQNIHHLQKPGRFGAWLKRIAINAWLQYLRRNDPLRHADEEEALPASGGETTGLAMDLDSALATLPGDVRLCIVLSYTEGMNHREIAELTQLPLGTVKSHIRRGTKRLQKLLAAYDATSRDEEST